MRRAKSLSNELMDASARITTDDESIFSYLQNQPDLAWMVTPSAEGVWYNKSFFDFSGKTMEYMRNWAWQDFLPLEEIPRVANGFYHALSSGQAWMDLYPQRGHDGKYRQFLVRGAPLHNRSGAISFWIGTATDVTDFTGIHKAISPRRRQRG